MSKKWYDSCVGQGVAAGLVLLGLGLGLGSCYRLANDSDTRRMAEIRPMIQQNDLCSNGIIETYIELDGVKYFSAIGMTNLEYSLTNKLH